VDGKLPDRSLPEVKQICDQLWMIPDFITEEQEAKLVEEINPLFKKKRYVDTHWDGVITGYKEIEKSFWVVCSFPSSNCGQPAVTNVIMTLFIDYIVLYSNKLS
jgi:hypothetical protein